MTLHEAIDLIRPGVIPPSGTWADIGAGTGLFTEALLEILEEGKVFALDKNTHSLYQSKIENRKSKITVEIYEADFNKPMILPPLDGILMANALHYAHDHLFVLKNVLTSFKPGGTFIVIEYDTDKPNPPWVPNPVSFNRFRELCKHAGLKEPVVIGRRHSIYQDGEMYAVITKTIEMK
ncbi:MAG: class I SAM-dependent methyltransferase [Saprospiraceae bacterium]